MSIKKLTFGKKLLIEVISTKDKTRVTHFIGKSLEIF